MARKNHSAQFKFRVALAAMKEDKAVADICQDFEVAPSLVHKWKKELLESGADLFAEKRGPKAKANEQTKKIQRLHEKVGELTLERDFLKKSWNKYRGRSD